MGKAFISSLCRISKWYIIATIWYVVATACETTCLFGCCRVVHMAILKTGPVLEVLTLSSHIGQMHPFFCVSILCTTVPPKTPSHREDHKICDIVHRPIKQLFFVYHTNKEYHTFYVSSFNLLCMTLFACSEEYATASIRKTSVILHCLMLSSFQVPVHKKITVPFQSLLVINLNFLISSLINSCCNLIYAVHFYLDTYFQMGCLDCSTAAQ